MSWWTYVVRTSGTERPKVMAERTGIDSPHFSKWKSGVVPGPQIAATFARAYGQPVLEAFVAAGYLTEDEANVQPSATPSLGSLSDDELVDEIRERLHRRAHGGDDDILVIVGDDDPAETVVGLGSVGQAVLVERLTERIAHADAGSIALGNVDIVRDDNLRVLIQHTLEDVVRETETPVATAARRTGTLTQDQRRRAVESARQVVDEQRVDEPPDESPLTSVDTA